MLLRLPAEIPVADAAGFPVREAPAAQSRFLALGDVEPVRSDGQVFMPRLRVLFLADDRHAANVVQDHVNGIAGLSRHRVHVVNPIHVGPEAIDEVDFDAILIHYSIFILSDYFLPPAWRDLLRFDPRPKVQIIQDEHRHIERMKKAMGQLGIRAVLSSLGVANLPKVYGGPHVARTRFYSSLPGYISAAAHHQASPPIAARPLDIVYRGRDLPFKLGRFAQEKELIGRQMKAVAEQAGLNVDIEWEEGKRIYGQSWSHFLMSGRATLGVEGGASIFDFDDDLDAAIERYRAKHPGAGFAEVWQAVLAPYEGNVVHKTITPKIFEAIALRTALILYPGEYRGVLEPGRHYIVLDPGGTNTDEVVAKVRDTAYLQALVDRTYGEIMTQPQLQKEFYVRQLDEVVTQAWHEAIEDSNAVRAWLDNLRRRLVPVYSRMARLARR